MEPLAQREGQYRLCIAIDVVEIVSLMETYDALCIWLSFKALRLIR